MADREPADLRALSDLRTPWSVHTVATLRIADHLAAGVTALDDLAAAAGCDAEVLGRVLRHLVGKGVFDEPSPGRFALNDAAQGFLDPGMWLMLDLDGVGGRFAYAWGTLPTYVRTGRPGYHEVFGLPFWDDLAAHPEVAASFDALMGPAGHGVPDPEVLLTDGWGSVRSVVDVGGGTGSLLAEILRAHSEVRGTLVDLPRTVAGAEETFQAAGVAERVTTMGQSFFDPLPAGADLYVLSSILNDWPDPDAIAILVRCAEAALPNGRVVVIGGVSADEDAGRLEIDKVLLGGRDRPVSEFREMARQAGLDVVAGERQSTGRFVVECRPT